MDQYQEAHLYFTVTEFARLAQEHSDLVFAELEFCYPDVAEAFRAYMCNKELGEICD